MSIFTNGQLTKIVRGQADMITQLQETIKQQQIRIELLTGSVQTLQAEIINAKQMFGHCSGRGMGSTVYRSGG